MSTRRYAIANAQRRRQGAAADVIAGFEAGHARGGAALHHDREPRPRVRGAAGRARRVGRACVAVIVVAGLLTSGMGG